MNKGISIIDLAAELGKRKQTIHKVIRRLGISPTRATSPTSRGQLVSYITDGEARIVIETLSKVDRELPTGNFCDESDRALVVTDSELGYFYLMKCEPSHDPGRFKVGFATNVQERIRHLRTSAPYIVLERTWPCRRLWEKTAIECVTDGCERLGAEVFRAQSIDAVITKCETFFAQMPKTKNA
jgi:T5orf172 domain-containing protein